MTSVIVRKGNIINVDAQAIVNAGNTSLWLGTGVAGAIKAACGIWLEEELARIIRFRSPRRIVPGNPNYEFPCELGEVVVTHAGNLMRRRPNKISLVFHAAVMDCKGPYKAQTDYDIIYECTKNCILTAKSLGLHTLAFPIFGTGVGGWAIEDSTAAMVNALNDYPVSDLFVKLCGFAEDDARKAKGVVQNNFIQRV